MRLSGTGIQRVRTVEFLSPVFPPPWGYVLFPSLTCEKLSGFEKVELLYAVPVQDI
jgi:hypothetical protein